MDGKKTCGPLYLEGLQKYAQGDTVYSRIYAAGFVNGQAEKVYLGACKAAMFRPSPERFDLVVEIACDAAERYGLWCRTLKEEEVWLCRNETTAHEVDHLEFMERNSPHWHLWRAALCGVPAMETDLSFHERKGYGEKCDV